MPPKKHTFLDKCLEFVKKYSPVINIAGYLIAIATLIITAHSAISSRKSLNLAIRQYQESLLPTWNWAINDSINVLSIHPTDSQIEIEDICAYFPTEIVGKDCKWDMWPEGNSLHVVVLKWELERYLEQFYKKILITEEDIICSTIAVPTYMQISYIHKGQRKIVNVIYLLRCEVVYSIEHHTQIMFSKLYIERYLKYGENGQELMNKLHDSFMKEYKTTLSNKFDYE